MIQHAPSPTAQPSRNPEGNTRLTAATGALLFVLLAVEGVTVLSVGSLLTAHVFVGVLLVGPLLVKIASATWRFIRYYRGDAAYVAKGPPPIALRLLGPLVIILSVAVIASGVLLVVGAPATWHDRLLFVHKATFVLWLGVTAIHVLGHLLETLLEAPRDFRPATRRLVAGASARQWLLLASLVAGLLAALWITPYALSWHGFFRSGLGG